MNVLKVLDSKLVYSHPWETVFIETVQTPRGSTFDYLLSKPDDFVVIVPFLTKTDIIALTQYKHGAQKILLGFPAGFIRKGETPLEAAKRELLEETGYHANTWQEIATLSENPTRRRNAFYLLFAKNLHKDPTFTENGDEGEGDIKIETISIVNLLSDNVLSRMQAAPMLSAIPYILRQQSENISAGRWHRANTTPSFSGA